MTTKPSRSCRPGRLWRAWPRARRRSGSTTAAPSGCTRSWPVTASWWRRGDLLAASDANADLHAALLELSCHRTAQALIRGLKSQTVRFQFRTILVPGRPAASHAEHRAIVDAVVEGRGEDAERAMRAHLLNVALTLRP